MEATILDANDDHSIFDFIYDEIIERYREMKCPWVVGYSGGKDSTAVLQMIWYALSKLPDKDRIYPIYIISSNTRVENPIVLEYLQKNIKKIKETAEKKNLPFYPEIVTPKVEDSYWVQLLGKGYAAPSQHFRWCTDRLKINPSNEAIQNKIANLGRIVIALGTRREESHSRKVILEKRIIKESSFKNGMSNHSHFPLAYVYSPIEYISTADVWLYLLTTQSPWSGKNKQLYEMYKDASGGECPFVIQKGTQPCGNSRFGCWVCTLVSRDKSTETLVKNGEDWLKPLLQIRNLLSKTQRPDLKERYRCEKRRNGQIFFNRDKSGRIVHGPYKIEFRRKIFRKLLRAQQQLQKDSPYKDIQLISLEEIQLIRKIWITEIGDWEDSIPKIYQEVIGRKLNVDWDDTGAFTFDEKKILERICKKNDVPSDLVKRLITTEYQMRSLTYRSRIFKKLEKILNEEWRPLDEVKNEHFKDLLLGDDLDKT